MLTRKIYWLGLVAISLSINTSCKKDCVSNCIQTPMFRIYSVNGFSDSLVLLVHDTATGNSIDTISYKNRINVTILHDGSIGGMINFNEGDELFKGRDLKALSFIFFDPRTNQTDTFTRLNWDVTHLKDPCHRPDGSKCIQIKNIRVTYKNKEYLITEGIKEKDKLFLD